MAEVIVQEESLVTVADAIREKTGGTEGLVFPTGFAEAIAGISTGANIATGTYTFTEDTSASSTQIYVEHGLNTIPSHLVIYLEHTDNIQSEVITSTFGGIFEYFTTDKLIQVYTATDGSNKANTYIKTNMSATSVISKLIEGNHRIYLLKSSGPTYRYNVRYFAGDTIRWIAW